MIGEFAAAIRGEKTAQAPAPIARTADDVYKSFGVAFRRTVEELAAMDVDLTDVNRNLSRVAGVPPLFVSPVVRLVAEQRMQAGARRANPEPEVNLERLGGG